MTILIDSDLEVVEEEGVEYELDAIVNHVKHGEAFEYKVTFKGYDDDDNLWMMDDQLLNAARIVEQYWEKRNQLREQDEWIEGEEIELTRDEARCPESEDEESESDSSEEAPASALSRTKNQKHQ